MLPLEHSAILLTCIRRDTNIYQGDRKGQYWYLMVGSNVIFNNIIVNNCFIIFCGFLVTSLAKSKNNLTGTNTLKICAKTSMSLLALSADIYISWLAHE